MLLLLFCYYCLYTSNSYFVAIVSTTIFNAVENQLKRSVCTNRFL